MKNKYASKLTEQMLFEIKQQEENITRLAQDQARTERQLEEMWNFWVQVQTKLGMDEHLAPTPQKQEIRCDDCHTLTDNYHIILSKYHYLRSIKCPDCITDEELEDIK